MLRRFFAYALDSERGLDMLFTMSLTKTFFREEGRKGGLKSWKDLSPTERTRRLAQLKLAREIKAQKKSENKS